MLHLADTCRQGEPACSQSTPLPSTNVINNIVIVEMLDGTEITETTRQFLRSWQANKDAVKQRLENSSGVSRRQPSTAGSISDNIALLAFYLTPSETASKVLFVVPCVFLLLSLLARLQESGLSCC